MTQQVRSQQLSGRLVASSTAWNAAGQLTPLVVAVACMPPLIHMLGVEQFGVLALCWSVIGYFGVFDLGLGQALTHAVAQHIANRDDAALAPTVWTTQGVLLLLGAGAGAIAWLLAPLLIDVLRISPGMHATTLSVFRVLALSLPVVLLSIGFRRVLEAHLAFRAVTAIRAPLSIWTFASPLLVLHFTRSLAVVVIALVAARLFGLVFFAAAALAVSPGLRRMRLEARRLRPLLGFSAWVTLDNLMDPIGGLIDRFLIGGLVSVAAVTYYTVAFQVATTAWVLPVAVSGVLFPALTRTLVHDRGEAAVMFGRGLRYLLLTIFPVTLLSVALARPGLQLWLGTAAAAQSTVVLQLLAVGTLITSLGSVADTFLQSAGRPDVSAKLAVGKVLLYLVLAWPVIGGAQLIGAAALWVVVTALEAAGMFGAALRLQHVAWTKSIGVAGRWLPLVALLLPAALPLSTPVLLAYTGSVLAALTVLVWSRVLAPWERAALRGLAFGRWRAHPAVSGGV